MSVISILLLGCGMVLQVTTSLAPAFSKFWYAFPEKIPCTPIQTDYLIPAFFTLLLFFIICMDCIERKIFPHSHRL